MIINHNLMANNAIRNMNINSSNASKSMQKLSSGLRINGAADDAAGLAISEKMRGQINGLDKASSNAQDGISMVQTAEGALNETTSILQRMRELATQAASDTNVSVDRDSIQTEINQLTSEINRIGNTTEFNTQKLLKGGDGSASVGNTTLAFPATSLLSGGTADTKTQETVTDTIAAIGAAATGKTVTFHVGGTDFTVTTDATGGKTAADSTVSADGKTITLYTANGAADLDTTAKSTTELASLLTTAFKNAGINGQYTVDGSVAASLTIKATAGSTADGSAGNIVASTPSDATIVSTAGTVTQGTDVAGAQAKAILDFTGITTAAGASALVGKGFTVGDQTIEFYDAANGNYAGNGIGVDIHAAANGTDIVNDIVAQAGSKLTNSTLVADAVAGKLDVVAKDRGTAGNTIALKDGGTQQNFKATLQIGANEGQSLTVEISDMRSKALGITGTSGATNFTATNTVTDGTNNTGVEAALDISSASSAGNAITVINNAINAVSAQRANLGAVQNRLEHTINNLGTSSENLTSAESRIRDVDMAKEMSTYSKNNILSQAAQAMLAQANQQPQQVLQLLR